MLRTITAPVGAWDDPVVVRQAGNKPADVTAVQTLLAAAAKKLGDKSLDPGETTGVIPRPPAASPTLAAVLRFQARYSPKPDGRVDPTGRTWAELVKFADRPPAPVAGAWADWCFPFAVVPAYKWTERPRSFGAPRTGSRKHAGCDLYAPDHTTIYAVADGELLYPPRGFYNRTDQLAVRHGDLVVRYGEIRPGSAVVGPRVFKGKPVAEVGVLIHDSKKDKRYGKTMVSTGAVMSNMLHFELYAGTATGDLSTDTAPYKRRGDLLDPTDCLNHIKATLPPLK